MMTRRDPKRRKAKDQTREMLQIRERALVLLEGHGICQDVIDCVMSRLPIDDLTELKNAVALIELVITGIRDPQSSPVFACMAEPTLRRAAEARTYLQQVCATA